MIIQFHTPYLSAHGLVDRIRPYDSDGSIPFDFISWWQCLEESDFQVVKRKVDGVEIDFTMPADWSQMACRWAIDKYFAKLVPQGRRERKKTSKANECVDYLVPSRIVCEGDEPKFGPETSIVQVVDRLAGAWTFEGWCKGYFGDSSDNQEARLNAAWLFYNEIAFHLFRQIVLPNSPQWFNTGLWWAYGMRQPSTGSYRIDEYGVVQPCTDSLRHPPASACFISTLKDSLVDDEGIFDTLMKEARIFKGGGGHGLNVSSLREENAGLSRGGKSSGVMSFMKIMDKAAGAIKSGGTTRRAAKMVIMDVDHPDIEAFIDLKFDAEREVAALSIGASVMRQLQDGGFEVVDGVRIGGFDAIDPEVYGVDFRGKTYSLVDGQNANNSIRVPDEFMEKLQKKDPKDRVWKLISRYDRNDDGSLKVKAVVDARDLFRRWMRRSHQVGDPGIQFHDTINRFHTCEFDGKQNASNPCSEYFWLDGACNLASANLRAFLLTYENGVYFDWDAFEKTCRLWQMVLDITAGMASYPSKEIAMGVARHRTIGLGVMGLGAALVEMGIHYDTDRARIFAGGVVSVLSASVYAQSADVALALGAFPGFEDNRESFARVMSEHKRFASEDHDRLVEEFGPVQAFRLWDSIVDTLQKGGGFRNAQASVIAPTGTISGVADAGTSGIEPLFAERVTKQLVGGGYDNMALDDSLLKWMKHFPGEQQQSMMSDLDAGRYNAQLGQVLATAVGQYAISPKAHIMMVASVQRYASGGVSKTVNLPADATVDDFVDWHIKAWELGLKSVSFYRDGSKLSQPLNAKTNDAKPMKEASLKEVFKPKRQRLPARVVGGYRIKLRLQGLDFILRTGEYSDGRLGEIFLDGVQVGSSLQGLMDGLAKSISLGLQYGVPLEDYVRLLRGSNFAPSGIVFDHETIKFASSLIDLMVKELCYSYDARGYRLAVRNSPNDAERHEVKAEELPGQSYTGDICVACGSARVVPNGTCKMCLDCGTTTGCS